MTQDDILRMAEEAGFWRNYSWTPFTTVTEVSVVAFAQAIRSAALEEAAKVCEDLWANLNDDLDCRKRWPQQSRQNKVYAAAIRKLKEEA